MVSGGDFTKMAFTQADTSVWDSQLIQPHKEGRTGEEERILTSHTHSYRGWFVMRNKPLF